MKGSRGETIFVYLTPRMVSKKAIYSSKHYASCIFMMLTLLWLTISAPFIVEIQKELNKQTGFLNQGSENQSMEENTNPFSGLNEEKSGNSGNALSEYLHEWLTFAVPMATELVHTAKAGPSIYIVYCGELLSPPPEL